MRNLVLASASPRRKELLHNIGLSFRVVPSKIEEHLNPRLSPLSQVQALSRQKADAVYQQFTSQDVVILAADTMVAIGDQLFGKPETLTDARQMLKMLSGKKHMVVTGFTLIDCLTGKSVSKVSQTYVWMKKLTDKEITSYVTKENVLDKAGSYAMQNLGAVLFEKIEGDYFTVAGLPMYLVAKELKKFGIPVL